MRTTAQGTASSVKMKVRRETASRLNTKASWAPTKSAMGPNKTGSFLLATALFYRRRQDPDHASFARRRRCYHGALRYEEIPMKTLLLLVTLLAGVPALAHPGH